jgi:hypothetical protein
VPEREPSSDFDAPWEARSFGVAVAFCEEHGYSWETVQERLAEEVDEDDRYYENLLTAVERALIEEEVLSQDEIRERASEFEAGDRDAGEFVEGKRGHGDTGSHTHDHPHDHNHD